MQEIQAAGFALERHRVLEKTISGSSAAGQREGFKRLLEKLERGDVLIVTKLDRLGRDVIDVVTTVNRLASVGVKVHCLQLGCADLTNAAGKLTMTVLGAVAQFERDLIIERTQAGLAVAKAKGKKLGRHATLTADQRAAVCAALEAGESVSALARQYDTSPPNHPARQERVGTPLQRPNWRAVLLSLTAIFIPRPSAATASSGELFYKGVLPIPKQPKSPA